MIQFIFFFALYTSIWSFCKLVLYAVNKLSSDEDNFELWLNIFLFTTVALWTLFYHLS